MRAKWKTLVAALLFTVPALSFAGVFVSVRIGPPALPVYVQPPVPGDGFIWTPGYWAWDEDEEDYYWVPGTWVLAPSPGLYWTPGWWGWNNGLYVWHRGYWGPEVGFYGGINYGFGYTGRGYWGGRWDRGAFRYNTAVNNVNVTRVRNVYKETVVVNNVTVNNISYNGGTGGTNARPTQDEERAERQRRIDDTDTQREHERRARKDREQHARVNAGKPTVFATPKPARRR
jgi:hypothetical protein